MLISRNRFLDKPTCRILYVLLSRKLLELFHYVAAHTGLDRWRWRSPLRLAIQSSTADSPFNVLQLWSVESKKALWKSGYFGAFFHFFFYPGLKSFYPDKIHACFTMPLILSQGEDSITTGVSAVTTSIWSRRPRSRTISHSDDIALCDTLECGKQENEIPILREQIMKHLIFYQKKYIYLYKWSLSIVGGMEKMRSDDVYLIPKMQTEDPCSWTRLTTQQWVHTWVDPDGCVCTMVCYYALLHTCAHIRSRESNTGFSWITLPKLCSATEGKSLVAVNTLNAHCHG